MKNNHHIASQKGFTLVEILVAMTLFLVVMAGLLPMYVQSSKSILVADSKLDINKNIRDVTNDLVSSAREADAFVMYDNYGGAWINDQFEDFRKSTFVGKGRLRNGETGKFLVLIYYGEDEHPDDRNPPPIEKLVGLYMDASESETKGPLRMFTKTDITQSLSMEENIPAKDLMGTHPVVLDSITGLMDGDVFYNFGGKSIMLNGKITHANGAMNESNTYNFTITPR